VQLSHLPTPYGTEIALSELLLHVPYAIYGPKARPIHSFLPSTTSTTMSDLRRLKHYRQPSTSVTHLAIMTIAMPTRVSEPLLLPRSKR